MNILPLFPTAIGKVYKFITEKERLELMASIEKISHTSHAAIKGDGVSTHGLDVDFLNQNIKNRLQDSLNEYAETCGFACGGLVNYWSNIQNADSRLGEHCHPNSTIVGALYINVSEDCELYFHNPNPYIFFTSRTNYNHYNYDWYSIPVENSQLVLFPAWLRHGKNDMINNMNNRIVISFNFGGQKQI
tara:strand:- start:220 stop:786 length:567 start_codon:yes stop_codon:yes gene_type:complete